MSSIDDKWIANFRQKLRAQGAVSLFENPSDADQAAMRAVKGIVMALRGMGLYSGCGDQYEYMAYAGKLVNHPDQETYTSEDWTRILSTNEPRAQYITHYVQSGGTGYGWRLVKVVFRIDTAEQPAE